MPPPPISKVATWSAAAAGAAYLGAFLKLSQELFLEGNAEVHRLDQDALAFMIGVRHRWLTQLMIQVTALGTPLVLGMCVAFTGVGLWHTRDRLGALLMAIASAGAIGWTSVLKGIIERERPPVATRLVGTSGYSYPSGHSLASAAIFAAITVIVCRHLTSRRQQAIAFFVSGVIAIAVAASRVYLGVHYLSDVMAGTSFGLAWTFSSVALLSAAENRALRAR